ncbi:MAG: hypothetical protein ACOC9B_05000 [Chloroflexota bacterium]
MQTWTHEESPLRASDGPRGPWDGEPDKAQWVDEATGLDCLIVRNHSGALCGYVGVPKGHPLYGMDYDEVHAAIPSLGVHGGLTFASTCDEDAPEGYGICHIPLPGRPADVWWLGFDTAHAFDYIPLVAHRMKAVISDPKLREHIDGGTYCPFDYVKRECEMLAAQIATHEAAQG